MLPSLMPSIGEVKSGMNPARRPKTEHRLSRDARAGNGSDVTTDPVEPDIFHEPPDGMSTEQLGMLGV
jgi:hypothetical protein